MPFCKRIFNIFFIFPNSRMIVMIKFQASIVLFLTIIFLGNFNRNFLFTRVKLIIKKRYIVLGIGNAL